MKKFIALVAFLGWEAVSASGGDGEDPLWGTGSGPSVVTTKILAVLNDDSSGDTAVTTVEGFRRFLCEAPSFAFVSLSDRGDRLPEETEIEISLSKDKKAIDLETSKLYSYATISFRRSESAGEMWGALVLGKTIGKCIGFVPDSKLLP